MDTSKVNFSELDAYLVQRSKLNNAPLHTVASLLTMWKSFVGGLSMTYQFTIDDYTNDLAPREILQLLLNRFPEMAAPLHKELKTDDSDFVRLTKRSKKIRQYVNDLDPTWLARIPCQVTDDFW